MINKNLDSILSHALKREVIAIGCKNFCCCSTVNKLTNRYLTNKKSQTIRALIELLYKLFEIIIAMNMRIKNKNIKLGHSGR